MSNTTPSKEADRQPNYLLDVVQGLPKSGTVDGEEAFALVQRAFGPHMRQIGRDLATLHLSGHDGREQVGTLGTLAAEALILAPEDTLPVARAILESLVVTSGGYLSHESTSQH